MTLPSFLPPSLSSLTDDELFSWQRGVVIGYALLVFAPRARVTRIVTLLIGGAYALMYCLLMFQVVRHPPTHEADTAPRVIDFKRDFGTLAGVAALFRHRDVVLAGWVHYISYDLLIARWCVLDSHTHGISHAYMVLLMPVLLMAGPVGLTLYLVLRTVHAGWRWCFGGACDSDHDSQTNNKKSPQTGNSSTRIVVLDTIMYVLIVALCVFLVVFMLKASARGVVIALGSSVERARLLDGITAKWASSVMPVTLDTITKYDGHPAAILLHHLPCLLWTCLLPLQLTPALRRRWPIVHRLCGYVFTLSAVVLTGGVFLIYARELDFASFHSNADGRVGRAGMSWSVPFIHGLFLFITAYFVASVVLAVTHARAHRYAQHRRWLCRHIGAGMWVGVMRVYVIITHRLRPASQQSHTIQVFADGAVYSAVLCVCVAELYVRVRGDNVQKKLKNK